MTTSVRPSREIDGKGRSIRELPVGHKYSIDSRRAFRKADLDKRQELYQKIAEPNWNPQALAQEALA